MKYVAVLLSSLFIIGCTFNKHYKISGSIENGKNKTLFLERMDIGRNVLLDSAKLDNSGKFNFKGGELTEPTFFRLKLGESNFITLLADSTEKLEVTADANNMEITYIVKNSVGSSYVKIINRKYKNTKTELDSLRTLYAIIPKTDVIKKAQIEQDYSQVLNSHKNFVGNFVMDNPRSFAGYYALFQDLNNSGPIMDVLDKKDQIYFATLATSLNLFYPESERVKHLYNYVLGAKNMQQQNKLNELLLSSANEVNNPELTLKTPEGKEIKLSSLKGKLVLLSFWASTDVKSRTENKTIKRVYDKYKSRGFEVYQVSLDGSKVLWESAIEQDQCTWINVSDLNAENSYAAKLYNVKELPTNFIISPKGEIIGKNLFGNRLEEKIAEQVKQ